MTICIECGAIVEKIYDEELLICTHFHCPTCNLTWEINTHEDEIQRLVLEKNALKQEIADIKAFIGMDGK